MIKIIIHGSSGHMGKVVYDIASADPEIEVAAGVDAVVSGGEDFPVFSDINDCDVEADCIVDFSTAAAIDALLAYGKEKNIPMVICTTGLSEEQLALLEETSKEVAILRSANMSLGINTIMKLAAEAARILDPAGVDTEIFEMHHNRKIDAPSGTAIALGECINKALDNKMTFAFDRSERREKRPDNEIGFSALRGGTVVGEHEVIFAGRDEVIKLTHSAFSRDIFAKGAISAAKFLADKGPGLYDMFDVIG